MGLPAALHNIAFIESLNLDSWSQILDVAGWPDVLVRDNLNYPSIVRFVEAGNLPPKLVEVLLAVHDLGDDDGQAILNAALREEGVDLSSLPKGLGPQDLAARLWCGGDTRAQQALLRAQLTAQERAKRRTFREYAAKEPTIPRTGKNIALRDALAEWCEQNDYGENAEVIERRRGGVVEWQLLHGYSTQTPLAWERGSRTQLNFRPLHGGMVRYTAATGRLKISARTITIANGYRALIGRIMFGSKDFFSSDRICTLQPLAERGQRALDEHTQEHRVMRASLVEALWQRGDDQILHLRAPDCFTALTELGISQVEGRLVEARIALTLAGKSARKAKVTIKVPNRVDFNRELYDEALVDRYLYDVGITQPGDEDSHDLWSLAPWRESPVTWRRAYPLDIDSLAARSVLKPIPLKFVRHPDHPAAGRVLQVVEGDDGVLHGISDHPDVPPRQLWPTDIEGLELQVDAFVREVAGLLGLDERSEPREVAPGLWSLGVGRLGDAGVAPFLVLRAPTVSAEIMAEQINAHAGFDTVAVLISPRLDGLPAGVATVPIKRLLPDPHTLRGDIVRSARLWGRVPAIDIAPPDASLVLDRHMSRVWLDGVELPGATASPGWTQFLLRLSDARGDFVDHETMSESLSVAREPKKIRLQLKQVITKAFDAAGRDLPTRVMEELLQAGGGGYRLRAQVFDPLRRSR